MKAQKLKGFWAIEDVDFHLTLIERKNIPYILVLIIN
jgi:hypothetical protein